MFLIRKGLVPVLIQDQSVISLPLQSPENNVSGKLHLVTYTHQQKHLGILIQGEHIQLIQTQLIQAGHLATDKSLLN